MAKAEGKTFDYVDESHIETDLLEVFNFDSPDQYIKSETDEFSAVCPFSGLPDILCENRIFSYRRKMC